MRGRKRLALGLAVIPSLLVAIPSSATTTSQVVQGQYLRIVSVADWEAALRLSSHDSVQWDLTISADTPAPGTVTLGVSAAGDTPLTIDAVLCLEEWRADECPSGATTLRSRWNVPRNAPVVTLAEMASTDVGHLRLEVSLGSPLGEPRNPTELRVHAKDEQESISAGSDEGLASTGMSSDPRFLLFAGAVASLVGASIWLALTFQRRRADSRPDGGA